MYYDSNGKKRDHTGAFTSSYMAGSTYDQLMAGVGRYDTEFSAAMKVDSYRRRQQQAYGSYAYYSGPSTPFDKVWWGWLKDFFARARKDVKLLINGSAKKMERIKVVFFLPFVLLALMGLLIVTSPLAMLVFVVRMVFIALVKIIKWTFWLALAMVPVALIVAGLYHFQVIDKSDLMRAEIFGSFIVAKYVLNTTDADWSDPKMQSELEAHLAPYRANYLPPSLAQVAQPEKASKKSKKTSHKASQ